MGTAVGTKRRLIKKTGNKNPRNQIFTAGIEKLKHILGNKKAQQVYVYTQEIHKKHQTSFLDELEALHKPEVILK